MMRKAFALFTALLLAGCGGGSEDHSSAPTRSDAADSVAEESDQPRAPGVTPTAAPGVAFNYHYAFDLPGLRISAVQEQHAASCERLGVSRCRITGMNFEQNGEDDV